MKRPRPVWIGTAGLATALAFLIAGSQEADSACCYFSAQGSDILQPAQKAFLTYDPLEKVESFTVQPKFEGNALDFGMVIPTPSKPRLDPAPRDFFNHLAVFTLLKKRVLPQSKLLGKTAIARRGGAGGVGGRGKGGAGPAAEAEPATPSIRIVAAGVVGSLEYKTIEADRADDLYQWLKDNKYRYGGDEATLDFYVKKKWLFTVMKIDTAQMKKNADGSFSGEVTPTRFRFASEQFVYPLKITQISVKDKTEALFYVQAPYKTDLPGDSTYQYQWIPMIQNASGWFAKGIFGDRFAPGNAEDWLRSVRPQLPDILRRGQQLGFNFTPGRRPQPNGEGRIATTLEWARKLTKEDIGLLQGEVAFSEKVPNPDEGFTQADLQDPQKRDMVTRTINDRLNRYTQERPGGYFVREAPEADVKALKQLLGHVQEGQFVTKFRKTFTRGEMTDDLVIIPAKIGDAVDRSEYTEVLPTSPP
jgi:Uncharacterized protein conserved in bacteria (DUF2330)